jgi:Fic family protein
MTGYIHDIADWTEFQWNHQELSGPLGALRYRQGRLIAEMESLGFALRGEAVLQTLTEDVLKTSEIEGEMLDRDQVRSSLARRLGVDIGTLTPADRHVDCVVEMMLDATQNHASPLTQERLFGWHGALFPTGRSGLHPIRVGCWRDDRAGPMQVTSGPIGRERVHFEAPAAARVAGEMARFIGWFANDGGLDPVLKAGVAHLWFITIHPFEDGNGRIARAIADMALARSEGTPQRFYSMSSQIRRERSAYYGMLESTQKGDRDITPWLAWFLACLDRAFDGAEMTLAGVLKTARFWEDCRNMDFNPRQRAMLVRLLEGFVGKLTASKWARIQKCSPDTALRDINDLMARGVLRRDAGGGRSTAYVLEERA